jgi:hypothetical protein
MLEKFSLKKQIEELEQHLNIINSNLNELNQISPDTDFNNTNLYKQLTLYYLSTKEIEPKNFIKDYIETINNDYMLTFTNEFFDSQAHSLLIETQSLLNIICQCLDLPKVYLSPELMSNKDNLYSINIKPDIMLSKAQAILSSAKLVL